MLVHEVHNKRCRKRESQYLFQWFGMNECPAVVINCEPRSSHHPPTHLPLTPSPALLPFLTPPHSQYLLPLPWTSPLLPAPPSPCVEKKVGILCFGFHRDILHFPSIFFYGYVCIRAFVSFYALVCISQFAFSVFICIFVCFFPPSPLLSLLSSSHTLLVLLHFLQPFLLIFPL